MSTAAARVPGARAAGRTLLPFRHLEWRSIAVGVWAATLPPAVTTVWLAASGGDLRPILALLTCLIAVALFVAHRLSKARIVLTTDGLRRWGVVARDEHVLRTDVARVVVLNVFLRDSLKTTRRLYLVDRDGGTLVRMSSLWWADDAIAAVVRHIGGTPETIAEPLTAAELRRMGTVQLRWRERHPLATSTLSAVLVLALSLVVVLVTNASV